MKQPMTLKEIEVWDAIAQSVLAGLYANESSDIVTPPEDAYSYATIAIYVRRAALIADAHVGVWQTDTLWHCKCDQLSPDVAYCETCHTRRPDEVYRLSDDGHVEAAT